MVDVYWMGMLRPPDEGSGRHSGACRTTSFGFPSARVRAPTAALDPRPSTPDPVPSAGPEKCYPYAPNPADLRGRSDRVV